MKINQRDIVEVCFELPDGRLKEHPATVISGPDILDAEEIIYTVLVSSSIANMEYAIELTDAMVTKPMKNVVLQNAI